MLLVFTCAWLEERSLAQTFDDMFLLYNVPAAVSLVQQSSWPKGNSWLVGWYGFEARHLPSDGVLPTIFCPYGLHTDGFGWSPATLSKSTSLVIMGGSKIAHGDHDLQHVCFSRRCQRNILICDGGVASYLLAHLGRAMKMRTIRL
jgi:hypothetical protein